MKASPQRKGADQSKAFGPIISCFDHMWYSDASKMEVRKETEKAIRDDPN